MAGQRRIDARRLAALLGDWRGPGAAYADLGRRLELVVLDGRLPLGTRLPGERDLALALGVSRTTTAAGYDALRTRGFLQTRPASGSVVVLPSGGSLPARLTGSTRDDLIDLAIAAPPAPPAALHEAVVAATEQLPRHLSGTGYHPLGLPELRRAVAEHFDARGLPTRPEQVLVTNGALHALALALRAVVGVGDRVLVEHPTYPGALTAIADAGARAVPVPFAGTGWDLEGVDVALRQSAPRLGYVIADFQSPTGAVLDAAGRRALVGAFRRSRAVLIADETLVATRLEGPELPLPVAAADPDGSTVVTIGSLSKAVWGGLTVGWVRASPELVARLGAVRAGLDLRSPVLEQLVATHLLDHPPDAEPRRAERLAARETLSAALSDHLPEWRFEPPAGGSALWIDLGRPLSSALAGAALGHGLRLAAGPQFGVGGAFETHVRLPYTLDPPTLTDAVERLAALWPSLAAEVPSLRAEPALVA